MIKVRGGLFIGNLCITWLDLWENTRGLELSWGEHKLFCIGFRPKPKPRSR